MKKKSEENTKLKAENEQLKSSNNSNNQWHFVADGDLPEKISCCKLPCFVEMKYKEATHTFRTMMNFENGEWVLENGRKLADKYEILAWQKVIYPKSYMAELQSEVSE